MYRIGIDLGGTNIAAGILKDKKIIKTTSMWKLTNKLLDIQWISEDIKGEIK